MKIGYFLSCEEFGPAELLAQARSAEKASLGALAGTGSGGMAGSAAAHAMAASATASPRRTSQEGTIVRFIVLLLVVPIAPTIAHGGPHARLCQVLFLASNFGEYPFHAIG